MKIKLSKLDILFSKYIRLRAYEECEYCGKYRFTELLQCSHFHGRRKFSTRYDEDNACALCYACHNLFHEHPDIHSGFFRKRLGSKRYEELNIRAQTIVKRTPQAEEEIRNKLKEKIKLLEGL